MTKHDRLTENEFKEYKPPAKAVAQLKEFVESKGVKASEIKVLDWGCGRGRFVLWLRENGYNAFGVDIDAEPVENGLVLFAEKGYQDQPLSLISASGRTVYADGFFDFVMSDNVLEHVSDLDKVIGEINRITATTGGGYHIFPAHRQFVEGHLFMPFVHWIPQGSFRKFVIQCCVKIGREPRWKELDQKSAAEKTEVYYQYSINHIFYRKYSRIREKFEKAGFKVVFLTINNPAVVKNKLLGPLSRNPITRPLLNWMLLTFKQVEIAARRV